MMRSNGFILSPATDDWCCFQCNERLDEVQTPRYLHTFSGETFKHPTLIATMCARCAWVADGSVKVPIWKWLKLRGKSTPHRDFLLRNQQRGLRLALAEVESELAPRRTLEFETKTLQESVNKLHRAAKLR
jgi:hypothetical protein